MTIQFSLNESNVFKWIEINASSPHTKKRFLRLGFKPLLKAGEVFKEFKIQEEIRKAGLKEREILFKELVMPVSFDEAEEISQKISEQFHIHMRVNTKEESLEIFYREVYQVPISIETNEIEDLRGIIHFCQEQNYISIEERAALVPFMIKVEEQIANSKIIKPELTPAQKDVIKEVVEPYLDAIIQACLTVDLGIYASEDENEDRDFRRNLAFFILTCEKDYTTLFYEMIPFMKDNCMESYRDFRRCYDGNQLESTFIRQGGFIPSLLQQRQAIYEIIEGKLDDSFGDEKDPLNSNYDVFFLQTMRKKLFIEGFILSVIDISYNDGSKSPDIVFRPFQKTIDALEGNLTEDEQKFSLEQENITGEEFLEKFEELKQAANIEAQKNIISKAENAIDVIISSCGSINSKEDVVAPWLDLETINKRDLAFYILTSNAPVATLFYEYFPGLRESCISSSEILHKCLQTNQRKTIFEMIEKKLDQSFGKEQKSIQDVYNQNFLINLRRNLYAEGFFFNFKNFGEYDQANEKQMLSFDFFAETIRALEGTLTDFEQRFYTRTGIIEGEEFVSKLEQIKQISYRQSFRF